MDTSLIVSCCSAAIAIAALALNFIEVKRQKTIENENHFFSYKMERYHEILGFMSDMLFHYDDKIEEGIDRYEKGERGESLFDIADDIDERSDEFTKQLTRSSFFLPENILAALDKFHDSLYDALDDDIDDIKELKALKKEMDKLSDGVEGIIEMMREDLGIEKLNYKLKRRIKD